jgi:hypothetical protein
MTDQDITPNSSLTDESSLGSSLKEKAVAQENTSEEFSLLCRRDPDNPGEYRCRPVPVVTKSPPVTSAQEPGLKKTAGCSLPKTPGNIEIWTRADGTSIKVRRILRHGTEVFAPVKETLPIQSK